MQYYKHIVSSVINTDIMTSDTSDKVAVLGETATGIPAPDVLLQQGAEGKLYLTSYQGQRCLVKERFAKAYRHPDLDRQLTRERMRAETKAIQRCHAAGIAVPKILNMDLESRRIHMEYFEHGCTVKHYILNVLAGHADAENLLASLGDSIGSVIGQMHKNHIIHGDLTTSNMLLNPTAASAGAASVEADTDYTLVMIDFGLSHYNTSPEDKGVDLYVLERALLSTHSAVMPQLFDHVLVAYRRGNADGCSHVIVKFEEVRARGRKRTMVG